MYFIFKSLSYWFFSFEKYLKNFQQIADLYVSFSLKTILIFLQTMLYIKTSVIGSSISNERHLYLMDAIYTILYFIFAEPPTYE